MHLIYPFVIGFSGTKKSSTWAQTFSGQENLEGNIKETDGHTIAFWRLSNKGHGQKSIPQAGQTENLLGRTNQGYADYRDADRKVTHKSDRCQT